MKMKINKFLSIALILIGIVAIVFAILCSEMYAGSYISSYSYGGDAYTGIQNAAADTGNNVRAASARIFEIAEYSFILIGLILEAIGISGLIKEKKPKETVIENTEKIPVESNEWKTSESVEENKVTE